MVKKASLAKISRPRLFGVVARERLFALLDDNRGRPLVWISGPPGAGKTTLVASYLEERELPTIWYQIDAGDADPASLFQHLSLAAEGLGTTGATSLPRFVPEHLSDLPRFTRLYIRAFFAQLPEKLNLVLDNYQEAPQDASLHEIFRHAVAEVPPDSSVIAISRVEAPSGFVQLAARGAMFCIGQDKLQLALDEVRAIAAKRSVTDDWLLKALHQQSQGWAAGITLMLEGLGHVEGKPNVIPTESSESVFNYFANLILDQVPESTRRILLALAFLPRVTPALAIKLSGDPKAPDLLEDLYRRSMFTDRRPGAEPVYQFHALFSDFLKSRAKAEMAPEAFAALLHRSAVVLEDAGEPGAAMDLWLEARDWNNAIRLILREANSLLNSGRRQTLLQWINALPESQQSMQPRIIYWQGRALTQIAPAEGIKAIERALNLFRQFDDIEAQMECLAVLLGSAFVGFRALEEMDQWLDDLLALMDRRTGFRSENVELGIWGVLATTLFHVRPWHPLTAMAYRRVDELLPECTDPGVGLAASMGALVVSGLCGDFEYGDRVADVAKSFASLESASPSEAAWCMAQVGWLRFMEGKYDEALEILDQGARIAEVNGIRAVLWPISMWRFTIEWRGVGWSAANATLAKVRAMPMPSSPMAEAMLRLFCARSEMQAGHQDEAGRLAALSQQSAMQTGSRLEEVIFYLSNSDIFLQIGKHDDAELLIRQLRELIDRAQVYHCYQAASVFMEARLAQVRGRRTFAIEKLRAAMSLAGKGHNRHYLRFCDYAMPPLFQLALAEKIEPSLVRDIIRMFRLKPPVDAPANWPWPVRIFTLGRFEVQVNGEPVEFSRKLPRKTLLLLKAIVGLGGREVSEQALCDSLWGDEEGDAARNALSITVLRLRKLLGANDSVTHQGGKISLNPELCWVDSRIFEARIADAGFDGQDVLALYGGTFLPDDEGESWSVAPRERLRGKFIHALSTYGMQLEAAGDTRGALECYLRGVEADPVVETFHQGLMRCYERLGRRTEAFSVYRRLRQTLSVVLGVPPTDATKALFQEMLARQSAEGLSAPADFLEPAKVLDLPKASRRRR